MDSPKAIAHVGLCAGYGGIELGLHRVISNLRSVALCEIEAFACANLVAKMEAGLMDPAPIWTNLKTFPWPAFHGKVDILTGGYPCQPFSSAGKRKGHEDPRHLWPFIADGIASMRPGIVFFENVEGHISLGLREVLADLAALGYRVEGSSGQATWGLFSAREVGAPHQRKRVFILAVANDQCERVEELCRQIADGAELNPAWNNGGTRKLEQTTLSTPERFRQFSKHLLGPTSPELANAKYLPGSSKRRPELRQWGDTSPEQNPMPWPSRPGEPQHAWEPPRTITTAERFLRKMGWVADADRISGRTQTGGRKHHAEAGPASEAVGHPEGHNERRESQPSMHGEGKPVGGSGCNAMGDSTGSERKCTGQLAEQAGISGASNPGFTTIGQAESKVGGNFDGASSGVDYAELCVTCDNRTDELRLLGNGCVPATVGLAFKTLLARL